MFSADIKKEIPLSEPQISGNELKYVTECLETGWVSSAGSFVNKFEVMAAEYAQAKFGVAVVNGTAALHLSLIACGVGFNDEVIVPALTFIAPVNAVRYCGASPVFMDCDPETFCIDARKVENFLNNNCRKGEDGLTYNKNTGTKTKAVIPVHLFGHPADMQALLKVSQEHNISVVEDATESLGSEYRCRKTGSMGKIGCFSFNGNKIITTGGGGMAVTNDKTIAEKIRHLSTQAKKPHAYEQSHDEIGYNYRLTNIQAALGVAQFERLGDFLNIKRRNALLYRELLSGLEEAELVWEQPWARSNFWFYTVKVRAQHKRPLIEHLLSRNIQVREFWKLIHTLPMYKGFESYKVENAQEAYDSCINIPCSVSLKEEDIELVAKSIKDFFNQL